MTAEPDLLPLLPLAECSEDSVREWCRANVAHATAAKDAEVEALRAEVADAEKVLRGALDANTDGEPLRVLAIRASNALYWRTERAERAEAQAERLAEALREYIAARDAYEAATRPPNSHAPARQLKHGDPIVLRYRQARAALATQHQEPKS